MERLRFSYLPLVLFFFTFYVYSQQSDSTKMTTEEKFDAMRDVIFNIDSSNRDSVMTLVNEMMKIAVTFKKDALYAKALRTKALVQSKYTSQDEALATVNRALKINLGLKNNGKEIVQTYTNIGLFNFRKANYVEATKYYLKALELAPELNLNEAIINNYHGLSDVCIAQEKYQDALDYALKAKASIKPETPELTRAYNAMCVGVSYSNLHEISLAEKYFDKAATIFIATDKKFNLAYVLEQKSDLYVESNPLKAIVIKLEAKTLLEEVAPNRLTTAKNMVYLGQRYVDLANNDSLLKKIDDPRIPKTRAALLTEAANMYLKGLTIVKRNNNINGILDISEMLSDLQAVQGDYKEAYQNLLYSKKLNDSLFSQENKNAIAKLESEKEVFELTAQNEKEVLLNKILIGSSMGMILIGFLAFRDFRHNRKLQNLKITELEKDKQLFAIDAMLKGQEEERSRIAKDLHDGLGGLLSGTKLSFTTMKENLVLTPENAVEFDKSLNLLDRTISDLRKVAHNLMPEALVKFGLNEALRDFCGSIQSSSKVVVVYQTMGIDRKLINTTEVFVYRIVQELVNNAIKHAEATEIVVQLSYTDSKIAITVEDNGKGYELEKIRNNKGVGLDNIAYRVQYLNGTIDTVTSPDNGTAVNIELNA